jgi:thiopurine S-methyltransferase
MNENNVWLERWEKREIGFNQVEANPFMVKHFSSLGLDKGSKVLVPLCGKTIDISWLLKQGYAVVGIELSEQAIIELFDELGVEPAVSTEGELIVYSAEDITIYVGDIFKVTSGMLGKIDAIYDRAALVALTTGLRVEYAKQLRTMTSNAPQLLLCFEYDQSLANRSPYSVDEQEVKGHYEAHYALELLAREDIAGGFKGKLTASDVVWHLKEK